MYNAPVLVLNQNFEPLNVCNARRAVVLVLCGKAEVLELNHQVIHSPSTSIHCPSVIRLSHLIRRPRPHARLSRKEVFIRDNYTCQYCGRQASGLTVDHVIPRSRGGKSVWENIVASCASCNRRKGNRLPREIQMHPRSSPRPPGPTVFIRIASPTIPVAWKQYLAPA